MHGSPPPLSRSFHTKLGWITLSGTTQRVETLRFGKSKNTKSSPADAKRIQGEILRYLAGEICQIPCRYTGKGTIFQSCVWNAVLRIPFGQTRTYQQIAQNIGRPQACRAVAQACKRNPLLLIVPCHRVVGTSSIGGYSAGIWRKKALLQLEQHLADSQKHS